MDEAQRAMQTGSNEVLYEVTDHIAVITLNAPERMNTISGPMLNDLTRLLLRANEDRDVRCVILTGNGRAFCAGLDLRKERSGDGISSASSATSLDLRNTPPTVLQAMDKPTICAVNGGAAGYGMDTALGCDIRIMAESAKLAAAFVKRGVVPESGGTWFLPRMIGWAKASELIFTGRTLSAREALEWGLANEVVPDAALMGRAREDVQGAGRVEDATVGAVIALGEQFGAGGGVGGGLRGRGGQQTAPGAQHRQDGRPSGGVARR